MSTLEHDFFAVEHPGEEEHPRSGEYEVGNHCENEPGGDHLEGEDAHHGLNTVVERNEIKPKPLLSAAAEHLMITQPTVTRKMKKLEQELGVTLFDRQFSNHIALNDTGVLAANEARKVLDAEENFTETVLNYDRRRRRPGTTTIY